MSVKATDTAFSADKLLADERNNDSSLQVGVALCCPCAKRTIQFGPRLLDSINVESEDPSSCRNIICWVIQSDSQSLVHLHHRLAAIQCSQKNPGLGAMGGLLHPPNAPLWVAPLKLPRLRRS